MMMIYLALGAALMIVAMIALVIYTWTTRDGDKPWTK